MRAYTLLVLGWAMMVAGCGGTSTEPDGADASDDAGYDAGHDAGHDAGYDAGHDAGYDAGDDAGHDAGHDAGDTSGPVEVYVHARDGLDAPGCGTMEAPYLTIQYAIDHARPPASVRVAAGDYPGSIVLRGRVSLLGGHNQDDWSDHRPGAWDDPAYRTAILATGGIAVLAGQGVTAADAYGFFLFVVTRPEIANNIVFAAGAEQGYGIYEATITGDPAAVHNNDLFGCSTALYRDWGGAPGEITDVADLNALADTSASGNVSVDPQFVSGDDWHLQDASPSEVREGGLDMSSEGVTSDQDGNPRTAPWSLGAFELDAR